MNVTIEQINLKFLREDEIIQDYEVKSNEEIVEKMNSSEVEGYDNFEYRKTSTTEGNQQGVYFKNVEDNTIKGSRVHLEGYMKTIMEQEEKLKEVLKAEKNGQHEASEHEGFGEPNSKNN